MSDNLTSEAVMNAFPRGVIFAWYSQSGPFPLGWAVCDGTNSTPDLRGRFLKGVTDMADVGVSDGNISHHHSVSGRVDGRTNNSRDASDAWGWDHDDSSRRTSPQATGLDHHHGVHLDLNSGHAAAENHEPPYVTMLFIMKL